MLRPLMHATFAQEATSGPAGAVARRKSAPGILLWETGRRTGTIMASTARLQKPTFGKVADPNVLLFTGPEFFRPTSRA
jgi:hypothetical protein